ncbi:G-protein beta WD-40 repeats containing protein [Reticulomyxa filosa]|uniref:G-protein beta WD-40 repeats containing protein n=1 Tax=Reticulomyxa filosa TaxID=46433 RepID=X6LV34_RETFI|nr:G-protein beta WD-40 repeats containing protein [Reticulomyxa filosa]|eukprot:ETO05236.1 G-protein beta WD-40 repeats containing protein [Reticulomyxa filosa]
MESQRGREFSNFYRAKHSNRKRGVRASGYGNSGTQENCHDNKFEFDTNSTENQSSNYKCQNNFNQNKRYYQTHTNKSKQKNNKNDNNCTGYSRPGHRGFHGRGNRFLKQENKKRNWDTRTYGSHKKRLYSKFEKITLLLKNWIRFSSIKRGWINDFDKIIFKYAKTFTLAKILQGHADEVRSVRFSADDSKIVSTSEDKTIRIWDVASGKQIRTFRGHDDFIYYAEFSLDGNTIVSCSYDRTIRLWNMKSGKEIMKLEIHLYTPMYVSFSSDGKYIVSGSSDNIVRLWNANSGKEIKTFEGHLGYAWDVHFSPNNQMILSSSNDKTIILWDIKSGKQLKQFKGHSERILSAKFSPCGQYIISCSHDKTIRIWDIESVKAINVLKESFEVADVKYFPDGQMFVSSCDKILCLWDIKTRQKIYELSGHCHMVTGMDISSDGNLLVSCSYDKTIRIWE